MKRCPNICFAPMKKFSLPLVSIFPLNDTSSSTSGLKQIILILAFVMIGNLLKGQSNHSDYTQVVNFDSLDIGLSTPGFEYPSRYLADNFEKKLQQSPLNNYSFLMTFTNQTLSEKLTCFVSQASYLQGIEITKNLKKKKLDKLPELHFQTNKFNIKLGDSLNTVTEKLRHLPAIFKTEGQSIFITIRCTIEEEKGDDRMVGNAWYEAQYFFRHNKLVYIMIRFY